MRDGGESVADGWALGHREALREALRAQASVLDRLLVAITSEYGDELQRVGRSPEQRHAERVKRLLDGGAVEGSDLGYELEGWHLGVIATGAGGARVLRDLAAGMNRRCLSVSQGEQSVWAWLGGRDRLEFEDLERLLADLIGSGLGGTGSDRIGSGERGSHSSVVFAFGEPAKGLAGWRLTHRQAQAALVVALRRSGSQLGVAATRYADVALLACALKDEALARALLDTYLMPLEDRRGSGPVLRETLRAYLAAECQASSAAVKLDVARSTVAKRLRMIEEKLGRTLHPCPAELEVALLLDELNVSAAPEISNGG